jgi:hypothetical protein
MAAAPARAAEPADVAELFPAGALAYAELSNPAELSTQLAALFKGTMLEDSIPFIHKRRDAAATLMEMHGKREAAVLGLLASPEMMAELKKLRGAAGALTGFTDGGEPEAAFVLLTGDSPALGLAVRAYLTMTSSLRKVADVSNVPIFQFRATEITYDNNGQPMLANSKKPTESPYEFTLAYTPGLFVVGTSKKAVSEPIKRFVAAAQDKQSLASTSLFKQAAANHRQAGLFYFVNFPEFEAKYSAANRAKGGMGQSDLYAWFTMLANPKAIKSVAGNIHFRDGGLSATLTAVFDPSQKSPLRDFLSGPDVKVQLLEHAHQPATLALAVTLPEQKRAATAVALCDAFAKANGVLGKLPRDVADELNKQYPESSVEKLLQGLSAVTLVLPTKQDVQKGTKPLPMLILQTEDAAAAAAWETFLPRLMANLAGAAATPQSFTETIDGVTVVSLPGAGLPWNGPIHFSRAGKTVVIGLDRKLVAAATTPNPKDGIPAGQIAPGGGPLVLVGVASLADAFQALLESWHKAGPVPTEPPEPQRFPNNGNIVPESVVEGAAKARKAFFAAFAAIPPAAITVRRHGDELQVELYQPKVLGGGLKPVIDAAALWLDAWGAIANPHRPFGGIGEIDR